MSISLTLAAALRPSVSRLDPAEVASCPRGLDLLYLVALGGVGVLLFLTGEAAINDVQRLATLSAQDVWTLPAWLEGAAFRQDAGPAAAAAESASKQSPATKGSWCCRPSSASRRAWAAS